MARTSPTRGLGFASLALLTCGLACSRPTEVVIDTRVERPPGFVDASEDEGADEPLTREQLLVQAIPAGLRALGDQFSSTSAESDGEIEDDAVADSPPPPALEPPRSTDQFDALLAAARTGSLEDLHAFVRNLAASGPETWPRVRATLLAERRRSKREYRQVLELIGGDVPNRYGHFDLHWKRAHGYSVKLSENWYEDLLGLAPSRIGKPLRPVLRDLLVTSALLRAAAGIAAAEPELVGEVVATLLDVAYVHEGTFRDEVGRAIDSLGNPALPHLLLESVAPEHAREGSPEERRAAYAVHCLDRMDRLHPQRAIVSVADDRRLLAAVLRAYGHTRDGEAAPLLLDFVDSDAPGVRRAAREAFEAYVTGPMPKLRRKSIRLLGGRTTTLTAELSYREQARLALRDRLGKEQPELLEPECRVFLPGHVIDHECEAQPERLFRAYVGWLDERRATRRAALVTQALSEPDRERGVTLLDTLLSDGGEVLAPGLIAPFYVESASARFDRGDRAGAAQLLRKSAMLLSERDPQRSRALTIDALVLEAEVEGIDRRGREMLLRSAAELDADSPTVVAGFTRLANEAEAVEGPLSRELALSLFGLLAGLGALAWIGARSGPWLLSAGRRSSPAPVGPAAAGSG